MEDIQIWYNKLSKQERYFFFILITYIILTSMIFLAFRTEFNLYKLLIGILIFIYSIYFSFLIIRRKPKIIYFYGDSRSNEEYYSKEKKIEIDLRELDKQAPQIENLKRKKTSFAIGCTICNKKELLPYDCKYCNKKFCSEHRLPEKHSCQGI